MNIAFDNFRRMFHPHKIVFGIVLVLTVVGFYYRIKGISAGHSFWADEAYIASVARDLYEAKISMIELLSVPGAWYQALQVMMTASMFTLFGATETAARIPSVLAGTATIVLSYMVAKGFSNRAGGVIAAFIMTFSQVMLAYSTQARPYMLLAAILLGILYCLQLLEEKTKRDTKKIHIVILCLLAVSSFMHLTGAFFSFMYLGYIGLTNIKKMRLFVTRHRVLFVGGLIVFACIAYIGDLYVLPLSWFTNPVNNITYFRELFAHQYLFVFLPAIIGVAYTYKSYPTIILGLLLWMGPFLYAWNFVQYSHNIRYLIPFFAVLFVFLGVFWGTVAARLFRKRELVVCVALLLLLYAGGYKIARKPAPYYSPNADLFADVQNANYQRAFEFLQSEYPNYRSIAVFNNIVDAQRWYLPDKDANAYFSKGVSEPTPHNVNGVMVYPTLEYFLQEKSKYEKGLLIVEDWESFLPEDIKQYAKKNMKLEYQVESLEVSQTDSWPIEIYSWGL